MLRFALPYPCREKQKSTVIVRLVALGRTLENKNTIQYSDHLSTRFLHTGKLDFQEFFVSLIDLHSQFCTQKTPTFYSSLRSPDLLSL